MTRKKYEPEFKQLVVDAVLSGKYKNRNQVASEFGISEGSVDLWLSQYRVNNATFGTDLTYDVKSKISKDDYIKQLEAANKRLEAESREKDEDIETLKKSVAILVKKHNLR
jgi:transposase-like protein